MSDTGTAAGRSTEQGPGRVADARPPASAPAVEAGRSTELSPGRAAEARPPAPDPEAEREIDRDPKIEQDSWPMIQRTNFLKNKNPNISILLINYHSKYTNRSTSDELNMHFFHM